MAIYSNTLLSTCSRPCQISRVLVRTFGRARLCGGGAAAGCTSGGRAVLGTLALGVTCAISRSCSISCIFRIASIVVREIPCNTPRSKAQHYWSALRQMEVALIGTHATKGVRVREEEEAGKEEGCGLGFCSPFADPAG